MQSFPIPYFPGGSPPRNPAQGRRRAPPAPERWHAGPTLMFSGVALSIFGAATILATCIASFG